MTSASSTTTASVVPTTLAAAVVSDTSSETEEAADKSVEESTLNFKCDQCAKGLEQHTRMKHRISQVDGIMDSDKETLEDIVTLQLTF